jgi:hypothetical protein
MHRLLFESHPGPLSPCRKQEREFDIPLQQVSLKCPRRSHRDRMKIAWDKFEPREYAVLRLRAATAVRPVGPREFVAYALRLNRRRFTSGTRRHLRQRKGSRVLVLAVQHNLKQPLEEPAVPLQLLAALAQEREPER